METEKPIHVTIVGEKSLLKQGSIIENNNQKFKLFPVNTDEVFSFREVLGILLNTSLFSKATAQQAISMWKRGHNNK